MTNNKSCVCTGQGSVCPEKAKNVMSAASRTADEALELLRATHERLKQMTAVFNSVSGDLKHNHSHNIRDLAALGGFLGDDWANYVDSQVEQMQEALDAAEGAFSELGMDVAPQNTKNKNVPRTSGDGQ